MPITLAVGGIGEHLNIEYFSQYQYHYEANALRQTLANA